MQARSYSSPVRRVEGRTASGVPFGAESGHAYRNMPITMKKMYSVPYETYEIKDYEAKYYSLLRLAAGDSISAIASVNPSSVLLLAKRLAGHTEHILRDIRDGTLRADLEIDPEIRRKLERELRPDPARASKLERAAREMAASSIPKGAWPDMDVIACWKGGTVGQYLEQFDDFFPTGIATRDLGYLSSENRGSVPLTDEGDSGVLAIATNFYEFFPEDASGPPEGIRLADGGGAGGRPPLFHLCYDPGRALSVRYERHCRGNGILPGARH